MVDAVQMWVLLDQPQRLDTSRHLKNLPASNQTRWHRSKCLRECRPRSPLKSTATSSTLAGHSLRLRPSHHWEQRDPDSLPGQNPPRVLSTRRTCLLSSDHLPKTAGPKSTLGATFLLSSRDLLKPGRREISGSSSDSESESGKETPAKLMSRERDPQRLNFGGPGWDASPMRTPRSPYRASRAENSFMSNLAKTTIHMFWPLTAPCLTPLR